MYDLELASRLSDARDKVGWTVRKLGEKGGYAESSIRAMEAAKCGIRPEFLAWVENLAAHHESNPPPKR